MISEYSVKLMKKKKTKTNKKQKSDQKELSVKLYFCLFLLTTEQRAVCDVKAWVKELMNVGDKIDVF